MLDQINQRWDESRMGRLTIARTGGATVTLNDIGVFIVGGVSVDDQPLWSSEFLAAGTMQWQEGPTLPVDTEITWEMPEMVLPCAVGITTTSFLVILRTDIREFDAATAGPTSNEGWRESGLWPLLKTSRSAQPGCAKIGQKVILAGGYDGGDLTSTEVLDLVSRQILSGGDMAVPRMFFHIRTIVRGGKEKMFAVGGQDNSFSVVNTVEEWVEESSTWKAADNLVEKRALFGAAVVPRKLICPV